jgi:hypothetical protein
MLLVKAVSARCGCRSSKIIASSGFKANMVKMVLTESVAHSRKARNHGLDSRAPPSPNRGFQFGFKHSHLLQRKISIRTQNYQNAHNFIKSINPRLHTPPQQQNLESKTTKTLKISLHAHSHLPNES